MKKVILIVGVSLAIFASCKKEYKCECTRTDKTKTFPEATTSQTIIGKKDDVAAQCEKGDSTSKDGNVKYVCVVN